jgi:hypothetical protein
LNAGCTIKRCNETGYGKIRGVERKTPGIRDTRRFEFSVKGASQDSARPPWITTTRLPIFTRL